jgi:uncharacterized protein (DUF1015 family)
VPVVRPFRALRYAADAVDDLSAVVAPPYDVIEPERQRELLVRDPRNVVRLDLPTPEPGDEPDDRYRRAARLLSAWRSDGTLRRDPRPSIYPYEQVFRVPATGEQWTRRGVFARVGLEPFGPDSGIRPHERTLAAPREDRYRLLRATGVNTSPVVGLYDEPSGTVARSLTSAATQPPLVEVLDDEEVRHRLWALEAGDEVDDLLQRIEASPITIADGHHRYETALRYRDERRTGAAPGAEAAWDYVLMLLLEPAAGPVLVLATHRVVQGLDEAALRQLVARLPELFHVRPTGREALVERFAPGAREGGSGRFGLWTREGGFLLEARREAFEALSPSGSEALRGLDVSMLAAALERLAGLDAAAVASGERIAYTKDAAEALALVDEAGDGSSAAFLLEPTPMSSIVEVAAAGEVMPQKSTYIHPKALTGLVINPLE